MPSQAPVQLPGEWRFEAAEQRAALERTVVVLVLARKVDDGLAQSLMIHTLHADQVPSLLGERGKRAVRENSQRESGTAAMNS